MINKFTEKQLICNYLKQEIGTTPQLIEVNSDLLPLAITLSLLLSLSHTLSLSLFRSLSIFLTESNISYNALSVSAFLIPKTLTKYNNWD